MKTILLAHAARYPLMKPQDAVKLIYQNEFGGGHLIQDEKACLTYLCREYSTVCQSASMPLYEDIGNHLVRVNLAALDAHGISPEELGKCFIRSAALHRGDQNAFRLKLSVLEELTQAGAMPFPPSDLCACLKAYEEAGFPPVSHSDTYRSAYHPAYRVVDQAFLPNAWFLHK